MSSTILIYRLHCSLLKNTWPTSFPFSLTTQTQLQLTMMSQDTWSARCSMEAESLMTSTDNCCPLLARSGWSRLPTTQLAHNSVLLIQLNSNTKYQTTQLPNSVATSLSSTKCQASISLKYLVCMAMQTLLSDKNSLLKWSIRSWKPGPKREDLLAERLDKKWLNKSPRRWRLNYLLTTFRLKQGKL